MTHVKERRWRRVTCKINGFGCSGRLLRVIVLVLGDGGVEEGELEVADTFLVGGLYCICKVQVPIRSFFILRSAIRENPAFSLTNGTHARFPRIGFFQAVICNRRPDEFQLLLTSLHCTSHVIYSSTLSLPASPTHTITVKGRSRCSSPVTAA